MAKQQTRDAEYRISRLARMFGLSRSTLLYYDRIGLLRPTGRTDANYRIYNHADFKRLEQICRYRRTGMALETIAGILAAPRRQTIDALERRLDALNQEIQDLRAQQQVIVELLKDKRLLAGSRVLDKQRWVAVLRAAGLDDEAMGKWHVAFEKMSPEAHQDFLESLGIDAREIAEIRTWSAKDKH
jgi:DNA-binding transcriptional MerR regulator